MWLVDGQTSLGRNAFSSLIGVTKAFSTDECVLDRTKAFSSVENSTRPTSDELMARVVREMIDAASCGWEA